jgi:hypothetical protein
MAQTKSKAKARSAIKDLRRMIDQAQREPGLKQLLSLLRHVQEAERASSDMEPAQHIMGGTFSHT